jgi:hypothetical protein
VAAQAAAAPATADFVKFVFLSIRRRLRSWSWRTKTRSRFLGLDEGWITRCRIGGGGCVIVLLWRTLGAREEKRLRLGETCVTSKSIWYFTSIEIQIDLCVSTTTTVLWYGMVWYGTVPYHFSQIRLKIFIGFLELCIIPVQVIVITTPVLFGGLGCYTRSISMLMYN